MRFGSRQRRDIELRLDLGWVRREIGDAKWESVAPSVFRFAEQTIEKTLRKRATCQQAGDGYTVRFHDLSRPQAVRRMEEIEQRLAVLLFGSGTDGDEAGAFRGRRGRQKRGRRRRRAFRGWVERIKRLFVADGARPVSPMEHEAQPAAPNESPESDGAPERPTPEALATTIGRIHEGTGSATNDDSAAAERPLGPDGAGRSGPTPVRNAPSAGAGRPAKGDGHAAAGRPAAADMPVEPHDAHDRNGSHFAHGATGTPEDYWGARSESDFDFSNAHPRSSRSADRIRRDETKALELNLAAAARKAEEEAGAIRAGETFPPNGLRVIYRPMWFVKNDVLSTFTCLPAAASGPFEFLTGDALLPPNHEHRHIVLLDLLLLKEVIAQIARHDGGNLRTLLFLTVHYETLTTPEGADYRKLVAELPQAIRSKIVLEIVNISRGVGQVETQSLILKMRNLVRAVVGRLELSDTNFPLWRKTDLSFVGPDLEGDNRPEDIIIKELERFAGGAYQENITTYIRGVKTRSMLTAAVMNGFVYIEGPVIAEGELAVPAEARAFRLIDVYEPLARNTALEHATSL